MRYDAVVIVLFICAIGRNETKANMMQSIEVNFLRGDHRLFRDANYTDFYFACT